MAPRQRFSFGRELRLERTPEFLAAAEVVATAVSVTGFVWENRRGSAGMDSTSRSVRGAGASGIPPIWLLAHQGVTRNVP